MPPRQVLKHATLRDIWRYIDADPDIPLGQANNWKQGLTDIDRKLAEHTKLVEELAEAQQVIQILTEKSPVAPKKMKAK